MVEIKRGESAESYRQEAKHVLFVEGERPDNFDPDVLSNFLHDLLDVKPMGPSQHIRAAAEALHLHHPTYYFLVDRDHHNQSRVDDLWKNFPNSATHNLLMWKRRELENYLIIPEYLELSQFCKCSASKLSSEIEAIAASRIHLEIANYVIVQMREKLKEKWIEYFSSPGELDSAERALEALLARSEIAVQRKRVSRILGASEIGKRFLSAQKLFLDESATPKMGTGKWFELIRGKEVLRQLVSKPRLFEVKNRAGQKLQGKEKLTRVVKDVFRLPLPQQPGDFQSLYELLEKRVKEN